METIKIKYFTDIDKVEKISKGDLIDLRAAEDIEMKAGEFKLIPLGVAMQLPEGYKANVYPRSSTYKNFSIIIQILKYQAKSPAKPRKVEIVKGTKPDK